MCLSRQASVLGCGQGQRKLYDRQFCMQAVETENVSYLQPVSFGWRSTEPIERLGDLFLAVHPPAKFLSFVLVHNSQSVLATVLVRHALLPNATWPRSGHSF